MQAIERVRAAARPGHWEADVLPGPLLVDEAEMLQGYLGEHRGERWFRRGRSEWRERRELIDPNSPTIGNTVYTKLLVDGRQYLRGCDPFEPGTFDARRSATPTGPPAPAHPTMRDGLSAHSLLTITPKDRSQRLQVRGVRAILDRLNSRGIHVQLSASGRLIAPVATPNPDTRALLRDLEPLIVPYLRDGVPPACGVSRHPERVEATTTEYAGFEAWCGRCEA
jgi:hypothetical protein